MTKEKDTKISKVQLDYEKEMIEVEKAESERKTYTKDSKKGRNKIRRRRIITGAVFTLLAFIGLISIFSGVVKTGIKILDNSGEKQEYNNLLATLVVYDPLPFESPEEADQQLLLTSSVWAAIMNENMELYEKNEYDQTLLPAADVDKYFTKVFGTQHKLEHGDFSDAGVDFEYDKDKAAYAVPSTSLPVGFTPKVEKIKSSFSEKIVTVGYVSPQTSWEDTSEQSVSKYVDYIFEKQDGQFCLVAVRESEMKVETVQPSPSPEA